MKILGVVKWGVAVLGIGIIVLAGVMLYERTGSVLSWDKAVHTTLSILQSDKMLFLVTDKITTQVIVEINENSLILGKREGVLVATVKMYYGVDLKKVTAENIALEGNVMVITLPQPEELDFVIDPASMRSIIKRSGLNVITDYAMNKNLEGELREKIKREAYAFLNRHDLMPTKRSVINQLRDFSGLITSETGMAVEFR